MRDLLSEIKSLQSPGDNKIYPEGIFPSKRLHKTSGLIREDDNSFFTALRIDSCTFGSEVDFEIPFHKAFYLLIKTMNLFIHAPINSWSHGYC